MVYKIWDEQSAKGIALQTLCACAISAKCLIRVLLDFDVTYDAMATSLSWPPLNTSDVIVRNVLDGRLPTGAVLGAVYTILISACILSAHQVFPLDCVVLSPTAFDEIHPPVVLKRKTTLAFVFPSLAAMLLNLNHVTVAKFAANHIAALGRSRHIVTVILVLWTVICTWVGVSVMKSQQLRPALYASGFLQVSAGVSLLIGHNIPVVIMVATGTMAMGTAYIITPALLWACKYHNHTPVVAAMLVVAGNDVAEVMYTTLRVIILPEIAGLDAWIYFSSAVSALYMCVVYGGNLVMEFITKRDEIHYLC